jgi:hypothetical protein
MINTNLPGNMIKQGHTLLAVNVCLYEAAWLTWPDHTHRWRRKSQNDVSGELRITYTHFRFRSLQLVQDGCLPPLWIGRSFRSQRTLKIKTERCNTEAKEKKIPPHPTSATSGKLFSRSLWLTICRTFGRTATTRGTAWRRRDTRHETKKQQGRNRDEGIIYEDDDRRGNGSRKNWLRSFSWRAAVLAD